MSNCKIYVNFPSYSEVFDATWINDYFVEGEDIAEIIFFSHNSKIAEAFDKGEYPEMTVVLDSDESVSSPVVFDDTAGLVFPVKTLP